MLKTICFLSILMMFSTNSKAADLVILGERVVTLSVDISETNLRLSRAGYSRPTVKVFVPELADVTILNHRNEGEAAPCLATFETRDPSTVLKNYPKVEKVKFIINLKKQVRPKDDLSACQVYLHETVEGYIRGFRFEHQRSIFSEERHIDDCR